MLFSDDVEILRHVELRGKKWLEKQSKEEYLQMLTKGWKVFSDYKFARSNTSIFIKNGEAFVTSNVEEYVRFQQQRMKSTSQQEVTVEVIRGKPLITKMVSYVKAEDI